MRLATRLREVLLVTAFGIGAIVGGGAPAAAQGYSQTNLVSDIPGLALLTDPALKNPWGVSESATSPFWISDQATNVSTLYTVTGAGVTKAALTVAIPTTIGGPQGPTGQVNNGTSSFLVGGTPANFIFANLNGTISAWNNGAGTTAQVEVPSSGAVYTGLAISNTATRLYAASGAGINVFNGSFAPVALPGAFIDPALPAGLAPFNVQNLGGQIYVTYAPVGRPAQISATAGMGAVAIFDTNGNFIKQLVAGSNLASPWGLALAPASFGAFGGDLLVGNFSFADSEINAFDPITGALAGTIPVDVGANTPGGLWDLTFGNGGSGGNPNTLYVTDGINGETDGLFAAITPVPEPSSMLLLASALPLAAIRRRRSSRR